MTGVAGMKLRLVSGGAAHGLVAALADEFRAATGCEIAGEFGAVGAMKDKLVTGAHADLVILTAEAITDLEAKGLVIAGSAIDLGTVHTGIAARTGDPIPAIDTATGLRDALRAADAIYFPDPARATAGIHFEKVLRQLGIAAEVAPRIRAFPNGAAAMTALAAQHGGRPIGCTQLTEILGTPGVELAGNLPHEFELVTIYTAAVATGAALPEQARHLANLLASDAAITHREQAGFDIVR